MNLLDRRVRGFRLVDLVLASLLVALVLGTYLAKTMAGRERAEIARTERQIGEERARIRLLQAEVAYLGLGPVSIKRDLEPRDLTDIARTAANTGKLPGEGMPVKPHEALSFDPTGRAPEPAPEAPVQ
jgi:hypothetical protein